MSSFPKIKVSAKDNNTVVLSKYSIIEKKIISAPISCDNELYVWNKSSLKRNLNEQEVKKII